MEQFVGKFGAADEQMLAVVEHQQDLPVPQLRDDRFQRR